MASSFREEQLAGRRQPNVLVQNGIVRLKANLSHSTFLNTWATSSRLAICTAPGRPSIAHPPIYFELSASLILPGPRFALPLMHDPHVSKRRRLSSRPLQCEINISIARSVASQFLHARIGIVGPGHISVHRTSVPETAIDEHNHNNNA